MSLIIASKQEVRKSSVWVRHIVITLVRAVQFAKVLVYPKLNLLKKPLEEQLHMAGLKVKITLTAA